MRCEDVRDRADDYLRGTLTDEPAVKLKNHLADCPSCTVYMSELSLLLGLLADIEEEPLPEGFEGRLHMRLLEAAQEDSEGQAAAVKRKWIKWGTGIAAALALILSIRMVQPLTDLKARRDGSLTEYNLNSMDIEGSQPNNALMEDENELKMNEAPAPESEDNTVDDNKTYDLSRPSAIYLYVSGNDRAADRIAEIAESLDIKVLDKNDNTIMLQTQDAGQVDELLDKLAELGQIRTESITEQSNNITIHVMDD